MTALIQDIRHALRIVAKSPAFSAIAVGTLALGIGASTALFSMVNGVLLNPLPFPQSSRLVALYEQNSGIPEAPISYLNFLDWQRDSKTFSSMAIYRHEDYNLTGTDRSLRVDGLMISASFLPTLQVHPVLGRDLESSDDHLGAAPVVLLGDGFWRKRYGGDPAVIGKPIQLDGTNYTVVGILPAGFNFYGLERDVFVPVGQWSDPSFLDRRIDVSAHAVGRLAPGATLAEARAEMDSIARHLAIEYPEADKGVGISVIPMKEDIVGNVQPILLALLAACGFLLLIACSNVASLLLARSIRRSGEFALRAAIGAGSRRIMSQLLTESLIIAGLGGAIGFLLAFFGTKAIVRMLPAALPRSADIAVDWNVLLFTLGISVVCGIGFGLAPALKLSRVNLQQVLRQNTRGAGGTRLRLQGLFVAIETALALVLLVGAGLMLRSLAALWRVNPGYNPDHAVTFSMSIPSSSATTETETRAKLRRFDAQMRSIPGVEAVSVTLGSRPMIHDSELPFWIKGQPKPASNNDMPQSMFYLVESGFQKAMGITLERGRFISEQDNEHAPVVIDVDDAFARMYFPNQDPIGKRIHIAGFDVEAEIVGIVEHIRQWGPGNDPKTAIEAQFFYPFMQLPPKLMRLVANGVAVVVRTKGDPASIMGSVRDAAAQFDSGSVIYAEETMHDIISNSLAARRLAMILLSVFSGLALVLSCVGIYGVISYLVEERTHEIGVRMALGAERGDVLRLVLGQGAVMAALGIGIGVFLTLGLARLIGSQLYGVTPHDPLTFCSAGFALLAVVMTACYVPARRATQVDPLVALRYE
ncbi:ABC transporter permease [Alloacidobacterium sp.]|uniref:ABC transporter permease n=1 Tax=Alloacidobacterium sp. TaxID=2951999 RepID=UPI002D63F96E|nr:ABC transporter permease [Alloacidobacterium sp.]HYK35307.1 ABC transporter permease [Alloacidobacterium sp.]